MVNIRGSLETFWFYLNILYAASQSFTHVLIQFNENVLRDFYQLAEIASLQRHLIQFDINSNQ